ncbi:ribosomal protein S18 acetylase RimI-like enzyme [Geodermatophilus bullaregiensis]|uniref:GNAT family N-acetyltransferase n=1 Tax=Geodermatophilus bullaregiensis TaxID=1564160 RepID=UPI0019585BBA|nr:GNAT family N-acetyltransferase [Geodermatophilus bullaregiensis]MBM7806866.1 ribosomal protein S18 acetylase RimI-like enzyme [Geodermatophilus bullaregiensis]
MIREFGWDDYPAVRDLWHVTARSALPEDELRATVDHGPGLLLVAEDRNAAVIGVVLGTFDGRRGWIHRLAVHPGHPGNGLATALVSELERRLIERGAPRINLLVMPDNAAGLTFWQRLGYLPCPDVLCSKPVC